MINPTSLIADCNKKEARRRTHQRLAKMEYPAGRDAVFKVETDDDEDGRGEEEHRPSRRRRMSRPRKRMKVKWIDVN